MSAAAGAVVLVGRVLFALYFGAVASVAHIRQRQNFEGYAKAMGFPLVPLAGWPAGIWLLVGGLSVALGVWPGAGVLMIALFVVVGSVLLPRLLAAGGRPAEDEPELPVLAQRHRARRLRGAVRAVRQPGCGVAVHRHRAAVHF